MQTKVSWSTSVAARAILGALLLGVLTLVANGCAQKVNGRNVDPLGNTTPAEREKITANLEAAGIKGDIVGVVEDDTRWIVDVGVPKAPPGQRQRVDMPITYLVDKASGKVTETGMK